MRIHTANPNPTLHEKLILWKRHGELGALDLRGYETRNESVMRMVALADARHDIPDFTPVMVHTGDRPVNDSDPGRRSLAFSRVAGFNDIAVPDFLFDGWPQVGLGDYEHVCAAAAAAGALRPGRNVLGWIGNCDTSSIRWQLHALGRSHPDLFEIDHVSWIPQPGSGRLASVRGNAMTLAEQVRRWSMLIDVEGRGWSARLKLLLHSGRPVFIQDRPYHEFFWDALTPMEHYIPVSRDLSDLLEQVEWAVAHPEEAKAIGAAGQAFAQRHLTRAAAAEAWADTLRRIAAEPGVPYAPADWCAALDPVLARLGALGEPELRQAA